MKLESTFIYSFNKGDTVVGEVSRQRKQGFGLWEQYIVNGNSIGKTIIER